MTTTAPDELSQIKNQQVQDLVQYKEGVETLLKLCSDKPIPNSEPEHAAILYEVFFEHAKEHVRIFCNKLSKNVFNTPALVHQASLALKRNVQISVMVQQDQTEQSSFSELLKTAGVPILQAPASTRNTTFNFATMDTRSVRIEPNRDKCEAQARMHAPALAAAWVKVFDSLVLTLA
jgi:hypothetical protein